MAEIHHQSDAPVDRAICEIHFELQEGQLWDDAWATKITRLLEEDYPKARMSVELQMQLSVEQGNQFSTHIPARSFWIYLDADETKSIEIRDSRVNIVWLKHYPGWKTFQLEILKVWDQFNEVVHPALINRVGLRYINKFERQNLDTPLSYWVKDVPYLPSDLLKQKKGFSASVRMTQDDFGRFIINVGESAEKNNDGCTNIIFDIDYIVEGDNEPSSNKMSCLLDSIHDKIRDIFDASVPDRIKLNE